jgi:hypothetical protein
LELPDGVDRGAHAGTGGQAVVEDDHTGKDVARISAVTEKPALHVRSLRRVTSG